MKAQIIHRISLSKSELEGSEFGHFDIKIRLDDECHNGHCDFSITGDAWYKGSERKKEPNMGGCVHEEILQLRPDLKPFVDLHLSDAKGYPMYAVGNGYYYLTQGTATQAMEHLRINQAEYEALRPSEDSLHFAFLLETLHIPQRWQQQAQDAIQLLETMSGQTFTDDSVRYQYTPLTPEQRQVIQERILSGYYDQDQIEQRRVKRVQSEYDRRVEGIKEQAGKEIKKIETRMQIELYVLSMGIGTENMIYYPHSNTLTFNWLDYGQKVTQAQLDEFLATMDPKALPQGIIINRKHQ